MEINNSTLWHSMTSIMIVADIYRRVIFLSDGLSFCCNKKGNNRCNYTKHKYIIGDFQKLVLLTEDYTLIIEVSDER